VITAPQLLERLDQGLGVPDARVFRFDKRATGGRMVIWAALGVGMVVFAALAWPAARRPFTAISYGVAAVFLFFLFSSLRLAVLSLVDLWHAKNTVLVVTPTIVVRRRRNKVDSWPFAEFPGLTYAYPSRRSTISKSLNLADLPPPEDSIAGAMNASGLTVVYLNRPGYTFDEELIDDSSFGPMNEILRALVTRAPQRGGLA
jgi:hypothetical protein